MDRTENQSSNGAPQGAPHLGQKMDHLGESAQQLVTEARTALHDVVEYVDLKGRVERHPYGMLAAAAGVGYVLGGGLLTPLTGRLLKLGMRLAALPFMKGELVGLAEAAMGSLSGQSSKSQTSESGSQK